MTQRPFYAFHHLLDGNFVLTFSNFVARTAELRKVQLVPEHHAWLDWSVLTQLSLAGKFYYIPRCLIRWRAHPKNYGEDHCRKIDVHLETLAFHRYAVGLMEAKLGEAGPGSELGAALSAFLRNRASGRRPSFLDPVRRWAHASPAGPLLRELKFRTTVLLRRLPAVHELRVGRPDEDGFWGDA